MTPPRPSQLVASLLLLPLALTLAAYAAPPPPPDARASFTAGLRAFAASNYTDAATAFQQAADAAPAAKLNPAPAHHNAGVAAFAAGDLPTAAHHFTAAASGPDLALQAQAYYNHGNTLLWQADAPLLATPDTPPDLANAENAIAQALQMYANAIALDPADLDAKANYELALLKQEQIQQLQQQQQEQQEQQEQDQEDDDDQQDDQSQAQPAPQPESDEDDSGDDPDQQPQTADDDSDEQPAPPPDDQTADAPPQPDETTSDDMTRQEAEMLLDALKDQEQSQRDRLHPFLGRPVPVEKDW